MENDENSEEIGNMDVGKEILTMLDKAQKIAYDYEILLKKGNFEQECPYLEIADIYREIIKKLVEKGQISQLETYSKEIEIYKKKYEKDKKLRQIEYEKSSKQQVFEKMQKIEEVDSVQAVLQSLETEMRVLNFEEQREEKSKEFDKILELIDQAEKNVKEYKLKIKNQNILKIESPYLGVIKIYEEAINKLTNHGWNDTANKLTESIEYYKKELERDNYLREIEKKTAK
ncbi:MAG: hypothetical protein JXA99_15995 [Candidatus Lokiarchaeota archaeon]|nr:hypothetical protein [Candidatus Lokiarchaeota archaeon]